MKLQYTPFKILMKLHLKNVLANSHVEVCMLLIKSIVYLVVKFYFIYENLLFTIVFYILILN